MKYSSPLKLIFVSLFTAFFLTGPIVLQNNDIKIQSQNNVASTPSSIESIIKLNWAQINSANFKATPTIMSITCDATGTYIICAMNSADTNANGAVYTTTDGLIFTKIDFLSAKKIVNVNQGIDGNYYAASSNTVAGSTFATISYLSSSLSAPTWTAISGLNGKNIQEISIVSNATSQNDWYACEYNFLATPTGSLWKSVDNGATFTAIVNSSFAGVFSFNLDSQNRYWLGTAVGAFYTKNLATPDAWTKSASLSSYDGLPVYSVMQDSTGTYWICTESGVYIGTNLDPSTGISNQIFQITNNLNVNWQTAWSWGKSIQSSVLEMQNGGYMLSAGDMGIYMTSKPAEPYSGISLGEGYAIGLASTLTILVISGFGFLVYRFAYLRRYKNNSVLMKK